MLVAVNLRMDRTLSMSNNYISNIRISISKKLFLISIVTAVMANIAEPRQPEIIQYYKTGQSSIAQEFRALATKNSQIIALFILKFCPGPTVVHTIIMYVFVQKSSFSAGNT